MNAQRRYKNELKGIAAAPGLAIAKAFLYSKEKIEVNHVNVDDPEEAKENLKEALERSKYELTKIFNIANEKIGERRAGIFEAQIMVLDDPILINKFYERLEKEKKSPDFIVYDEMTKYQNIMSSSNEPYMHERSHDIEDIKNRIIRNLQKRKMRSRVAEDAVIITDNLTPADTLLFSRCSVKGFVTNFGGLTSHAAIISRSLNIPAVVGVHDAVSHIKNEDTVIVDGFRGKVIINPDEKQLNYYLEKISKLTDYDAGLTKLRDLPAVTLDGREIILRSNVDVIDELDFMFQNGAKGIGLLRTEQIFSDYAEFPEEDEQLMIYKEIAEKIYPERVIIRAFDVGGDKFLPHGVKEANPFLGWRGIRFLLDNIHVFKKQIRAVLRANIHKNIKFMIPMVASIDEVERSIILIEECKKELREENVKFGDSLLFGIMMEVPSAAILANEFAALVDFMSIGTNDLIQFLLAVDRGNDIVSEQYKAFHPAVIKTIHNIIVQGKAENALVSMCGEMAADALAAPLLVGMGLYSLSVSPSAIPYIKNIIRNIRYDEAKELAENCLKLNTEKEITALVNKFHEDKLLNISKERI